MSNAYETLQIGPPFKGLFRPYELVYNQQINQDAPTACMNWKLGRNGEVMQMIPGYIETSPAITAGRVKAIAPYFAPGALDLVYIAGRDLRYNNSASDNLVVTNMLSSDYLLKIPWVTFQGRILFATTQDGLWWYDPVNHTSRKCGVAAHTTAPTMAVGAAGVPNGVYFGWVSDINDQGHEGNLSASGTVTVASQKIEWSNITVGPAGTSKRRLYRSTAGGTTPLLLTTINDNTTTVYSDNNADSALGAAPDNNWTVPSNTIQNIAIFNNRVVLVDVDGRTLWTCKVDSETGLPNFEAYPSSLSLSYPFLGGIDKFQAAIPIGQVMYCFGNVTAFRTMGEAGAQTYTEPLPWDFGFYSPFSYAITSRGLIYMDNSLRLRLFDGKNMPEDISDAAWLRFSTYTGGSLSGPDFCYDPLGEMLYINYGASAGANTRTLIYHVPSRQFTEAEMAFDLMSYNKYNNTMYATKKDIAKIMTVKSGQVVLDTIVGGIPTVNQFNGTGYDGLLAYGPISPVPGEYVQFLRMVITLRALPFSSGGIVPLLKAEWAFDDETFYNTKYVDVSKNYLTYPKDFDVVTTAVTGHTYTKRVVEVPIFKRAESLKFKLTTAARSSPEGFEIYSIQIHYRPATKSADHMRDIRTNPRLGGAEGGFTT